MKKRISKFSKIIYLIGKKNLIIFFSLFPVGLISVFLELISIAIFLPLMQSIFDNSISANSLISKFSEMLILFFKDINILFIFVFIIIAIKNLYIIFQNYYFLTVSQKLYLFICEKIFLSQISLSYLKFIEKSSSFFLKDLKETPQIFRLYLESLINFIIEITVCVLVILFLLTLNFKITIAIFFLFFVILYLYSFVSKSFTKQIGKKQNESVEEINNSIINTYHNFVDIRLYGQSNFFLKNFSKLNLKYSEFTKVMYFIFSIPKSIIELIIAVVLIIFFFLNSDINFKNNIALFGMYLVAIYRLLPSAVKLTNLRTQLNAYSFSIDHIYKIVKRFHLKKKYIKKVKYRIDLKNISFSYDKKNFIFKNLSLTFKKNQIVCLYGKSGCGKTTLVRILSGLLGPYYSGSIYLDNQKSYKDRQLDIAYVSQNFFIMKDSLINNIIFDEDNRNINKKKLERIVNILELNQLMKTKNLTFNSILTEDGSIFSGGQRQRIAIARALYRDSEIIILDESTNALDLKTENKIIKNLHEIKKDKIIIIISHRKETKKACDVSYDLS